MSFTSGEDDEFIGGKRLTEIKYCKYFLVVLRKFYKTIEEGNHSGAQKINKLHFRVFDLCAICTVFYYRKIALFNSQPRIKYK